MASYDESEMVIKLEKNGVDAIVSIKEDGRILNKTVSMEEIISKLMTNYSISTGLLPRGTRIYSGTQSDYAVGIEIPAGVRPLHYIREGQFKGKVPFPPCFMVVGVKNTNITYSAMYAAHGPVTSDKDNLYNFPFGNVYNDGHICWGGVKLSMIKNPIELLPIVSSFMDSEYNGDLMYDTTFNPSKLEGLISRNLKSLLTTIENKEVFPLDILVKAGQTVSGALKRAKGN